MCLIFLAWMEYYNVVMESIQYVNNMFNMVLKKKKKTIDYIKKYLYFKFGQ